MWEALITGGAALASGLLQQQTANQSLQQNNDQFNLTLQDNEATREAQAARLMEEIAAQIQIAGMKTAADKEIAKKNLQGQGIMEQGKAGSRLQEIALQAIENRPERYNQAASVLAQILRGR